LDGMDGRQRDVRTQPYTEMVKEDIQGLRIGVVEEGFGLPESHPGTDRAVREAVQQLRALGAVVESVSVPWHRHGFAVWSAVANEGCYHTLYGGFGAGHLTQGAYPLGLMTALSGLHARANEMPHTLKIGMVLGAYMHQQYQGRFYAKGQNLRRQLRQAYDQALQDFDLLLMPTTPFPTMKIPADDAPVADIIAHSWTMLANTSPFDMTGHPAISVPCGETDDKPVGLMLVGRHFEDGTVLRAAAAYERGV